MKKLIHLLLIVAILTMTSISRFADSWNGAGPITLMYIYPTYAVVVQGSSGRGPANCTNNDGAWSFSWSDFSDPASARIMSMLLSAYLSGKSIQV